MKTLVYALLLLSLVSSVFPQSFSSRWLINTESVCELIGMNHAETSVVFTTGTDSTYFLDIVNGSVQHGLVGGGAFGISADDTFLFHYSKLDSTFVKVSIATGEKVQTMQQDFKGISSPDVTAVSRDCHYGAAIYRSRQDNSLYGWRVWDLTSGKIIMDRSYMTDKNTLKTIGLSRPVFMCDENKLLVEVYKGYYGNNKDSVILKSYSTLFDISSGDSVDTFPIGPGVVAMNNNCTSYAVSNYNITSDGIVIYSRPSKNEVSKMQVPGVAVYNQIVFSQNNQYLLANSNDSLFFICQVADGKKVYSPGLGGCVGLCINRSMDLIPVISRRQVAVVIPPLFSSTPTANQLFGEALYPNPTSRLVSAKISAPCDASIEVKCYDNSGRVYHIAHDCDKGEILKIDAGGLLAGVYHLVVTHLQQRQDFTLVIN